MEESWENWALEMEMEHDRDLLEEWRSEVEEEEFLREILSQPAFSSESESQPFVEKTVGGDGSSLSSDETVTVGAPSASSSCRTYILSFDNSTILPATPQLQLHANNSHLPSKKPKQAKRGRTGSQTLDHIMAERKRRQQLTERFIALSATIPGLKKTDKSSILGEAINYVKQLQERVTELEERNNRVKESMIILKKTGPCVNEDTITTSGETNSEDNYSRASEMLPDVEARVMENEVLIEIHCEKEDGVELKILDQLENLHLSVTASSIMPFGNSTLGITIIAQMGDAYGMTVNDLVKNLRQVLLSHMNNNTDPY